MDQDQEMSHLTLPDTNSYASANVMECLAAFLEPSLGEAKPEAKPKGKPEAKPEAKPKGKPEAKPEAKPKGKPEAKPEAKPKGKGKGKAPPVAPVVPAFAKLHSTNIVKYSKGGRPANPLCDNHRRQLAVPVYEEGVLEGMWKMDPLDKFAMTPQANRVYHAFNDLISDPTSVVLYSTKGEIGHPWFPKNVGCVDSFLTSIIISSMLHFQLWDAVCGANASVSNLSKAVNKIVIMAGFSQEVHHDSDTVMFTFDIGKWQAATSLHRNGVGGGGSTSRYQGRPTVVVAKSPAAAGGSA